MYSHTIEGLDYEIARARQAVAKIEVRAFAGDPISILLYMKLKKVEKAVKDQWTEHFFGPTIVDGLQILRT